MAKVVDSDGFRDEIIKLLAEYGDGVVKTVEKTVELETSGAVKALKSSSPVKTGDYQKSWGKQIKYKPYGAEGIVYSKKEYRLTHLLEFGHANRDGGRTKAIPHIGPVNDDIQIYFESDLRKALSELK